MKKKLSYSVIWGFIIASSTFFARPLYNLIISIVPRTLLAIVIGIILFSLLIATIYKIISFLRKNPNSLCTLLPPFALSTFALIGLLYVLDLPEEKIHILLYGILGSLRAFETKESLSLVKVTAFVFIFSLLSECLQALIPGRFFDIRDIGIDSLSGIAGAALAKIFLECDRQKN